MDNRRHMWLAAIFALLALANAGCGKSTPPPVAGGLVEMLSKEVVRTDGDKTTFRFKLRCVKTADKNYRVLFHGYVKDDNLIPPEKRNPYHFLNCAHNFSSRPDQWQPGQEIDHEVTLPLAPGEYNFHFGLYDRHTSKALPGKIELGWMQLPPP